MADQGEAPTVVEIGVEVGLRSRSSVVYQLRKLEEKHAIRRNRGRARGIRLT
ncbi:LexA family protein [Streptomyces sp. EKR5.2]|uniref:LexA family protein n=1 Tax=Streptomyces sp. EKR5.2 TaxID=3461014 RepID=UPI004041F588